MLIGLKRIYEYRELLLAFVLRDIKARYKQTYIGIAWSVIQPLLMTIIFTVVFAKFLGVKSDGIPYPVFSYIALTTWTFFSRIITVGSLDLVSNYGLISKIYFPRELLPLSTIVSSFFDFIIASSLWIFFVFFYHLTVGTAVFFVPIVLLVQLILAAGLTLLAACVVVIFRDLRFVIPFLMQIGMYASPVIYSVNNIQPKFKFWLVLNPLSGIIEGYRSIFLLNQPPNFLYLGVSLVASLVIIGLAFSLFNKIEKYLIDVI